MKKIPYSNSTKAIVYVIQSILSVGIVLCIFLLAFLVRNDAIKFDKGGIATFEKSDCFRKQFEKSIGEIDRLIHYKTMFENEDGLYSSKNEMDIAMYDFLKGGSNFVNGKKHQRKQIMPEPMYYCIEDLLEWAQEGYKVKNCSLDVRLEAKQGGYCETGEIVIGEEHILIDEGPIYYFSDLYFDLQDRIETLFEHEKISFDREKAGKNMTIDAVIAKLNQRNLTVKKSIRLIDEKYKTSEDRTIREELQNGMLSMDEAEKESQQLENVLDHISEDIREYKRLHACYETDQSNFIYWVVDSSIIGNAMNCTDINRNNVIDYAKNMGSYMYWDADQIDFRTNLQGIDTFFFQEAEQLEEFGPLVQVLFAVNTEYPYADAFSDAKQEYDMLSPWVKVSIFTLVIGSVAWIICILFLTAAAGRNDQDEEIHLNMIDRIYTEIIIVTAILFFIGMIYSFIRLSLGNVWEIPGIFFMSGVLALFSYMGFCFFYSTLVKRVKKRSLWTGSLSCICVDILKKAFEYQRLATKFSIIYLAHVGCILLFAYEAMKSGDILWGIAFAIFLILEGAMCAKEIMQRQNILEGVEKIMGGDLDYKIQTESFNEWNERMGEDINRIGEGLQNAVDESMKNERMKADLITNVSHDIKTPLTSIINYANLIKRENIQNDKVNDYVDILVDKSERLKQLTEDLVEASKISSGNITLYMTRLDLVELIYQTGGEFNEKFEARDLTTITKLPRDPVVILADGRRIWRVIENLYNNVAKYAMEHTRVYVELEVIKKEAHFSIRNISQAQVTQNGEDLTSRFVRGDESRTTEGSGLGLSIAKNLTILMNGKLEIKVEGDLFCAEIVFPIVK